MPAIPSRFKKGVIVFIIINSAIKIFEYKITRYYDFEVAIILMFLSSLIIRYIIIIIYDLIKVDWLLIEHLKEKHQQKQEATQNSSITRKISKYKRIGKNFLLVALIFIDPVITVLYYRKGHYVWNKIPNIKTLILFVISVMICTITLASTIYSVLALIDLFWILIGLFGKEINLFWIIMSLLL
jgi:hypothetical protein